MTAVTLFQAGGAVPAHIAQRELNANTMALAGNTSSGRRISIKGGVFRMVVDGKEVAKNKNRDMNVVIVRTAPTNSRIFYEGEYVEGDTAPPTCSSNDGIKPDARIKTPQAASCAKCPQNIAGSGRGDSRACRYSRRLAVVLDGDFEGEVYQLQLPATSIFGKGQGTQQLPLEAYARMLASNKVNVDSVVTKMEFDTDSPTPKLVFSPVRYLTAEELAIVETQGNSDDAERAIGLAPYDMDAGTTTLNLPKPAEPEPQPVAAPTPRKAKAEKPVEAKPAAQAFEPTTDDEDEAETVAEPVKKPEPTAAKANNIKNVLDAWGDD